MADFQANLPLNYILVGKLPVPCRTVRQWAEWFGKADRYVAVTEIESLRVSTVFVGLDYSFGEGPPLLFETMIFGTVGAEIDWHDDSGGYQTRCSTWDEAERMHAAAEVVAASWVAKARMAVAAAKLPT